MDKIQQYYSITDIKPFYNKTYNPFHKSGPLKIKYNERELELHYLEDLGVWTDSSKKKGGYETEKISIIEFVDSTDSIQT